MSNIYSKTHDPELVNNEIEPELKTYHIEVSGPSIIIKIRDYDDARAVEQAIEDYRRKMWDLQLDPIADEVRETTKARLL